MGGPGDGADAFVDVGIFESVVEDVRAGNKIVRAVAGGAIDAAKLAREER